MNLRFEQQLVRRPIHHRNHRSFLEQMGELLGHLLEHLVGLMGQRRYRILRNWLVLEVGLMEPRRYLHNLLVLLAAAMVTSRIHRCLGLELVAVERELNRSHRC